MIRLIRTANDDNPYDHYNRHKTWIEVGNHRYASRLLNQFDLAECVENADMPLLKAERRTAYLRWLARHIRNEDSIIYYELSLLADAADAGQAITVTVHADSTHGEVIVDAIHWMQRHTVPIDDGHRQPLPDNGSFPLLSAEYQLIEEETLELDPDRIVWVLGKTVAHMAYLHDMDGIVTAAIPGYGLVKLGRFAAYGPPEAWPAHLRPCVLVPNADWEDAILTIITHIDGDFAYPRYDQWDLQYDPANRGPEVALPMLPRPKRLKFFPFADPGIIRLVWRWNSRPRHQPRLRILDPDKQAQGRLYFYRPATPQEYQTWHSA